MAQIAEIQCINKTDRQSAWERIRNVGGVGSNGKRWKITQEAAIGYIERGEWRFYVSQPRGDTVDVIVAVSVYGNKYIKTVADGDQPNNLLSLPECP